MKKHEGDKLNYFPLEISRFTFEFSQTSRLFLSKVRHNRQNEHISNKTRK